LFQKAGAKIGNILTTNKLFCIISEKNAKLFAFYICDLRFSKSGRKDTRLCLFIPNHL